MNFRRWITALAVLALFAGLANAQILSSTAGTGPFQCTASVAVPPVLRAEGLTEMVGDIVLTCTGGPQPTVNGVALPTANVTVSFQTNVTSRLLSYNTAPANSVTSANTSEALLLIDEPGSGLQIAPGGTGATPTGVGPQAPQLLCQSGGAVASLMGAGPGGCPQYVQQTAIGGDYVMSSSPTTITSPANVYAGVAVSNQVTFFGIPILPPTSTAVSRVYRMTNIRINANALGASGFTGTFQVSASISISGSTSVPIYTPVQIAGFVQTGLTYSVNNTSNTGGATLPVVFNQCSTQGVVTNIAILRYAENFGTAFKTRSFPYTTTAYAGQATNLGTQNIPGAIYNSESGFIFPQLSGAGTALNSTAGLADYGTRLKAVFNNIPTGVRIFVSTTNIVNIVGTVTPSLLAAPAGNSSTTFAQLVLSETAQDGNMSVPSVPAAGFVTVTGTSAITQLIGYAELSVVANTASATWEIVNTNPSTNEVASFGVWLAYTANAAAGTPPLGTATVNMSYAPIPTQGAFTAAAGGAASSTLVLPRFADTSTAQNLFQIVMCTTNLLFPFITNQAGFDTGIALMNTTTDPWGTANQAGICSMYFYGNNVPTPNPVPTPIIPSGNTNAPAGNWAFMASNIAPNFEGYMIAICQFQLAHGYAFVSDLGAQKLAHGYLALILGNGTSKRAPGQSVSGVEALEN